MKKMYVIIVYPFDIPQPQQLPSIEILKKIIRELVGSLTDVSIHNSIVNILADEKHHDVLKRELNQTDLVEKFQVFGDSFDDWDTMNHHLNVHTQRAIVSTDSPYYFVVSGTFEDFSHQIFTEYVNWESDVNIGITPESETQFILFKKQFTPFFYKLSDKTIKTGERNLTLFQQYKRNTNVIRDFL